MQEQLGGDTRGGAEGDRQPLASPRTWLASLPKSPNHQASEPLEAPLPQQPTEGSKQPTPPHAIAGTSKKLHSNLGSAKNSRVGQATDMPLPPWPSVAAVTAEKAPSAAAAAPTAQEGVPLMVPAGNVQGCAMLENEMTLMAKEAQLRAQLAQLQARRQQLSSSQASHQPGQTIPPARASNQSTSHRAAAARPSAPLPVRPHRNKASASSSVPSSGTLLGSLVAPMPPAPVQATEPVPPRLHLTSHIAGVSHPGPAPTDHVTSVGTWTTGSIPSPIP